LNHSEPSSILDLRVGELLDRLGSSDPTPGGGAAAALAGAIGAALIQMTANLTIGRPRLVDVEPQARSIESRAADLKLRLAKLGDADAEVFAQVGAAYKLPRGTDEEKTARTRAIQAALQAAAGVPLETAQVCADVIALAEEAAPILNASVISDVLVGAEIARAALDSAALNVEINLASMTDPSQKERLSGDLARAQGGVGERVARVLEVGRSRFPKS
jgi:formiminotetrahydrofolate cyclodeaminase